MNIVEHFQCEHCHEEYRNKDKALECEASHIVFGDLVIVRAGYTKRPPVIADHGHWPDTIIVGKKNVQKSLVCYKFQGDDPFCDIIMGYDFNNYEI